MLRNWGSGEKNGFLIKKDVYLDNSMLFSRDWSLKEHLWLLQRSLKAFSQVQ